MLTFSTRLTTSPHLHEFPTTLEENHLNNLHTVTFQTMAYTWLVPSLLKTSAPSYPPSGLTMQLYKTPTSQYTSFPLVFKARTLSAEQPFPSACRKTFPFQIRQRLKSQTTAFSSCPVVISAVALP